MSLEHMNRIGRVFERALSRVLTRDDIAVGDLDLFTMDDWGRISQWNDTLPPTRDSCIHEVIQDQCSQRPSKDAICAWDGTLTFSELDTQTARLAYYLQLRGIGPETRVPLCFDKSVRYTYTGYLSVG